MASKRRLRRNSCGGKTRYDTEEAAKYVVRSMKRTNNIQGMLHAYHCAWCGMWHVGHTTPYRGGL